MRNLRILVDDNLHNVISQVRDNILNGRSLATCDGFVFACDMDGVLTPADVPRHEDVDRGREDQYWYPKSGGLAARTTDQLINHDVVRAIKILNSIQGIMPSESVLCTHRNRQNANIQIQGYYATQRNLEVQVVEGGYPNPDLLTVSAASRALSLATQELAPAANHIIPVITRFSEYFPETSSGHLSGNFKGSEYLETDDDDEDKIKTYLDAHVLIRETYLELLDQCFLLSTEDKERRKLLEALGHYESCCDQSENYHTKVPMLERWIQKREGNRGEEKAETTEGAKAKICYEDEIDKLNAKISHETEKVRRAQDSLTQPINNIFSEFEQRERVDNLIVECDKLKEASSCIWGGSKAIDEYKEQIEILGLIRDIEAADCFLSENRRDRMTEQYQKRETVKAGLVDKLKDLMPKYGGILVDPPFGSEAHKGPGSTPTTVICKSLKQMLLPPAYCDRIAKCEAGLKERSPDRLAEIENFCDALTTDMVIASRDKNPDLEVLEVSFKASFDHHHATFFPHQNSLRSCLDHGGIGNKMVFLQRLWQPERKSNTLSGARTKTAHAAYNLLFNGGDNNKVGNDVALPATDVSALATTFFPKPN
jgi:hypothetical protein